MARFPRPAALSRYVLETSGTAERGCLFNQANGDEEADMYIGIGGLILLILILVVLF